MKTTQTTHDDFMKTTQTTQKTHGGIKPVTMIRHSSSHHKILMTIFMLLMPHQQIL
jgi:hypothetical protein